MKIYFCLDEKIFVTARFESFFVSSNVLQRYYEFMRKI